MAFSAALIITVSDFTNSAFIFNNIPEKWKRVDHCPHFTGEKQRPREVTAKSVYLTGHSNTEQQEKAIPKWREGGTEATFRPISQHLSHTNPIQHTHA